MSKVTVDGNYYERQNMADNVSISTGVYGDTRFAIEKIENGFLVTMGSRRFHATCAEEICGETSQWVLDKCAELEKATAKKTYGDLAADMARAAMPSSDMLDAMRYASEAVKYKR